MEAYKNRHLGETCALLLNGESVTKFSPEDWVGPIIGTNHSWELACATYHVVIDWKQLKAMAESDAEFDVVFVGAADATERARESLKLKRKYYDDILAKRIVEISGWEGRYHPQFVADFTRPVWCPNVAVLSFELATWMGFKRVDVWGLDLHGSKFWALDWGITNGDAHLQKVQTAFILPELKRHGVTVFNRNAYSQCGAFPKEEKEHGCNA